MEIKKITVLGAGLMGSGIAHVSALAGFVTRVFDTSQEQLTKTKETIRKNLLKGVELNKISETQMNKALALIDFSHDMKTALSDTDLVIEAVPEDMELKKSVFKSLDNICPPQTILATNTSAKSITEIASVTSRPEKVIGMHFFNPAHIMKLVEIIKGLETSEETFSIVESVAKQMGKVTVSVNESPGFATTRISSLIGNEAFYMLMEGVASAEDIDKAVKYGLNFPMGPFELADLVGLDTRLKNLEYLHETLGERFRPCPLLVKYVKAGRLGRKTGRGVYDYSDKK